MDVLIDNADVFASAFWVTAQLCVLSAIGALAIGCLVAVARISPVPPLRWFGTAYVTVLRNCPLTIVFFFTSFGLPELGSAADFLRIPGLTSLLERLGTDLPYYRFAVIALTLYTGAFVCEAIRSGINAVPAGQAEAARAIGLTFGQNLRHIIMPQAWKAAIVPMGSVLIAMIKNSALAGLFGVTGELFSTAQSLTTAAGEPFLPVAVGISLGFLILTAPLGILLDRIERRRVVAR